MVNPKQISSINQPYGNQLISDGSGGTFYSVPKLQNGNSFPLTTTSGDTYYHLATNDLYYWDYIRLKWLTINKSLIQLNRNTLSNITSGYLGVGDFYHTSSTGVLMFKNGTITNISLINDNSTTRNIEVRINNSTINIVDLSLLNSNKRINNNANLDFSKGDFINVFIKSLNVLTSDSNIITADNSNITADLVDLDNTLNKITVLIEIAWRT